jgi:CBS domain-containing protein
MTVAMILRGRGETVTLSPDMTVADAVRLFAERRIGAAPVMDGGRLLGVFSERDVIHCLEANGAAALALPVTQGMTAPAITVTPDQPVIAALSLMTRRRIRHLPVMEGDRLVGFVSIGDLVKYRMDRIEAEAAAMRNYIAGA